MARRRRGSDHKVSQPVEIFSKAAFRSATRRSSAAKSKQVPTTAKSHKSSSLQTRKEGVERTLTSQQLASRLNDAKDERFTLLIMNNLSHQTGDLFFKGRDFLHIATSLTSLFHSLLCLAFG
jgi:hypothetical protein